MAEFPALPLFTDAYLADTRHLNTEEHGAYLLLMMEAWRRPECSLPDDDRLLARLAGLPLDRWQEVRPVVMQFWRRDGRRKTWTQRGSLRNAHLCPKKAHRKPIKRQPVGRKQKRLMPRHCQTNAQRMPPHPHPHPQ